MRYFKLQKLEFKQLIDDMAINLRSSLNFVRKENTHTHTYIWVGFKLHLV